MRFDETLHAKLHAQQVKPVIEYPKYITVDGKQVLVLTAEEEHEKLGISDLSAEESEPDSESESETESPAQNLLSEPQKRPRGRPVGWRKPVPLETDPKE